MKFMSLLAIAAAIAITSPLPADEIKWSTSYADAVKSGKPVFIYFTRDACGYCMKMEKGAFADPDVIGVLNGTCVAVKAHYKIDGKNEAAVLELFKQFDVHKLPTLVLVPPRGQGFHHVGYLSSSDLKRLLKAASLSP